MKSFYATSFKSLPLVHSNDKFLGRIAQLCKKYASTFTLLFFGLFINSVVMGQATVMTDLPDYAPGQYVVITGSGWLPGETVRFHFDETPVPAT